MFIKDCTMQSFFLFSLKDTWRYLKTGFACTKMGETVLKNSRLADAERKLYGLYSGCIAKSCIKVSHTGGSWIRSRRCPLKRCIKDIQSKLRSKITVKVQQDCEPSPPPFCVNETTFKKIFKRSQLWTEKWSEYSKRKKKKFFFTWIFTDKFFTGLTVKIGIRRNFSLVFFFSLICTKCKGHFTVRERLKGGREGEGV